MKATKLLLLAIAALLCQPMMAQKKKQTTPAPKEETKAVSAYTVRYALTLDKKSLKAAQPKASGDALRLSATATATTAPAATEVERPMPFGPSSDIVCVYEGTQCHTMMPGFFYALNLDDQTMTLGVRDAEPAFYAATCKLSEIKPFEPEFLGQLAALQEEGSDKKASELLFQYYRRTDQTKTLCGMEVRRYELLYAKGNIWVAEGISLNIWSAPFWGINHPVLECDITIGGKDCGESLIHLTAKAIIPNVAKYDVEAVKNATPAGPEEVADRMCILQKMLFNR